MEPRTHIENFLHRIRRKRAGAFAVRGTFLLLAVLTGSALAGNLMAYFFPPTRVFAEAFLFLTAALAGYILYTCFWRERLSRFSAYRAARLAEEKYPQLQNSLVNSCQLKHYLDNPEADRKTSLSFISELLRRTRRLIENIDPVSVVDSSGVSQSRRILIGSLALLALAAMTLPNFFERGYSNWFDPVRQARTVSPALGGMPGVPSLPGADFAVENLALTFNYPAYTGLKNRVIDPSDGKVQVLPGTEVEVSARSNLPAADAELVLNGRDHFSMRVTEETTVKGRFIVREKGFYQFRLKDPSGPKHLLAPKYPIALDSDRSPSIILLLANPKPVYFESGKVRFFYEGQDDFGISSIDLVVHVNGKTIRKEIKRLKKSQTEIQSDYTWPLNLMRLKPGDEVQYYLEIKDNDNVFGPNTGQSETYTFTLFDSEKEKENLLVLQEELTEKMIALLGGNLVTTAALTGSPSDPMSWKRQFSENADALIGLVRLAKRIKTGASSIDSFPQPYLNLLESIISGLSRIRQEQINELTRIQNSVHKPTQAGYSSDRAAAINGKLIRNLEQNILFLVKMTNRQKMDRVMDLEKHLSELTESLREEFEKIRDKKTSPHRSELMRRIEQIQRTLEKIMEQIARQTQSLPDEFLNPNAFKHLNLDQFSASLEKLMNMVKEGKFDEALEELAKVAEDLRSLANQLNQEHRQLDDMVDLELMEKLEESASELERLEKEQQRLIEKTTELNQSLRDRQSKNFENRIEDLFDLLKKDVNDIQALLKEDQEYLDSHPVMKTLRDLMEQEDRINQEIQALGQKTVDSSLSADLEKNFRALNQARKEWSGILREKDSLRVNEFQKFKETLPRLQEKYDALEELAELADLNEFNNIFKNTYPEVFRVQNNLRTSPNRREDMAEKVDGDLQEVTRLNSEISKKLGSMMRAIRENYQSLLSKKNKEKLKNMANQQNRIRQKSEDLARRFSEMNQQNPMITPELSGMMSQTGKLMKQAENNLKANDVPGGVESENRALSKLQETRDLLQEMKNTNNQMRSARRQTPLKLGTGSARDSRRGGSIRMQRERVLLPEENQYQVPTEFREEILEAMKKQTPKTYERMVGEYYKELVK